MNKKLKNTITALGTIIVIGVMGWLEYSNIKQTKRLEEIMKNATPIKISVNKRYVGVDYYLWQEYEACKSLGIDNQWAEFKALGEEQWIKDNGSLKIYFGRQYIARDCNHDGKLGQIPGVLIDTIKKD